SVGELPTSALFNADFVVVTRPFQHHLPVEQQKVVKVVFDAFVERWEVTNDFELLPRDFAIPASGRTRVWKRVRTTSPEIAYRTAERILRYVKGEQPPKRMWYSIASRFNAQSNVNPDGSSNLTGHPARADAEPQTTFQSEPVAGGTGSISGFVRFYDERCLG